MNDTPTHARAAAAQTRALRYMSDCLHLAQLCRKAGCRRSGTCTSEPRDCLARLAPLVPEDAREWMKAAIDGLRDGRDFDDVRSDYPDEFDAFAAWRETLAHAFGK